MSVFTPPAAALAASLSTVGTLFSAPSVLLECVTHTLSAELRARERQL